MNKPDPDSREARLAAQLRRNLRRRKAADTETEAPPRPAEDARKDR